MLRVIGLLYLLLIFFISGYDHITQPEHSTKMFADGNFKKLLKMANVPKIPLSDSEFVQLAGVIMVTLASFVLLGVFRSFAAVCLALFLCLITVSMHVNIQDPLKTDVHQIIHILKNIGLVGGLFIVASIRRESSRAQNSPRSSSDKKHQ